MLTVLVDYDSGNLHSAEKAFQRMAAEVGGGDILGAGGDEDFACVRLYGHALKGLFGGMQVAGIVVDEDGEHFSGPVLPEAWEPPAGIFKNR